MVIKCISRVANASDVRNQMQQQQHVLRTRMIIQLPIIFPSSSWITPLFLLLLFLHFFSLPLFQLFYQPLSPLIHFLIFFSSFSCSSFISSSFSFTFFLLSLFFFVRLSHVSLLPSIFFS